MSDDRLVAIVNFVREHTQARKDELKIAQDLYHHWHTANELHSLNHKVIVASAAYDAIETLRFEIELMVLLMVLQEHT